MPKYSTEVDYVADGGAPRQIRYPEGLTDITTSTDKLTIKFYEDAVVGSKVSGIYATTGGPKKIVEYENLSSTSVRVTVTEGSTVTSQYLLNENLTTQTYEKIDELSEKKTVRIYGVDGNEDTTEAYEDWDLSGSTDVLLAKTVNTFHTFVWGERLIKTQEDPSGANLTTVYKYETVEVIDTEDVDGDSNTTEVFYSGRLLSTISPDGSWSYTQYDRPTGVSAITYRTWLDGALPSTGEPDEEDRIEEVQYENGTNETYIAGTLVKKSQASTGTGSGAYAGMTMKTRDEWYGSGSNKLTTTTYSYSTGDSDTARKGKTYVVLHPDGRSEKYEYTFGTYASGTFTSGTGTALRTAVIEGTSSSLDGVTNKTTKRETIEDADGHVLEENTYVYTGSGYELMTSTEHTYSGGKRTASERDGELIYEAEYDGKNLVSETDESGIETTYTYDDEGRVATSTREGSPDLVTTYAYDLQGRQISETVTGGSLSRSSSRTYDVAGRVATETDTEGRAVTYSYSNGGRTVTETGPGGVTRVTNSYLDGQLKSSTGTGVVASYYHYGSDGAMTQYTEERIKDDTATRYTKRVVDGLGREISLIEPAYGGGTRTTTQTYNSAGQLSSVDRPGLGDISYTYSDPWTTTQTTDGDADPDQVIVTGKSYEEVSSHAHADDGWYRVNTQTTGTGGDAGTTVYKSSVTGGNSIVVDGEGNETVSTTSTNRSTKTIVTSTYSPGVSTPSVTTMVNGLTTATQGSAQSSANTYTYDGLERPTGTSSPEYGSTSRTYDGSSSRVASVTAQGQTTNYSYHSGSDAAFGLLDTETDPASGTKTYTYNNRGQVTAVAGTATYKLGYTYDGYGQLTELKTYRNAAGSPDTTTWAYQNTTGLLTSKTDAASKAVSYTYTSAHLPYVRTWARGVTTTYSYNGGGQLTGVNYSDSTPDATFSYDSAGRRVTSASSSAGTTTLAYDAAGQLLSEAYSGGPLDGITVSRGYTNGKRTSLSAGSVFPTQSYSYSSSTGRWDTITQGSFTAQYGYTSGKDLLASVASNWSGSTVKTRNIGYDSYGRLTSTGDTVGSTLVNAYGTGASPITYDSLGRRTQITKEDGSTWNYGYNARSEVTSGSKKFSGGSPYVPGAQFTYAFDDIGNRTTAGKGGNQAGSGLDTITYTGNALNQYSAIGNPDAIWVTGEADSASQAFVNGGWAWRNGGFLAKKLTIDNSSGPVSEVITVASKMPGAGSGGAMLVKEEAGKLLIPPASQSLTYDDDGNLLSDGLWTCGWDGENRLITMQSSSSLETTARRKLSFSYDPAGRRIGKDVYAWNSGTSDYNTTPLTSLVFVYDGWKSVAELDASDSNAVVRRYVWGPDLSNSLEGAGGIGGLLAVTQAAGPQSGTCFFCYDANGNITALVKSGGEITATYEYGPFGETAAAYGPLAQINPFQWSTKFCDDESGYANYGYRLYNSGNGRWLSRDPIGESGGRNIYGMIGNNAISQSDYLGLMLSEPQKSCKIKRIIVNFNQTEDAPNYPISPDGMWNNPTGRVFLGEVTVELENGVVWTASIQTGGMRTKDSTVLGPRPESPKGDDSAVPAGKFTISTTRPGKGFPIDTSGTSRGSITMHYADYRGSHGCPTLRSTSEWEDLKELMKINREQFKLKNAPIRIQYSGVSPVGSRGNGRNDPPQTPVGIPTSPGAPSR